MSRASRSGVRGLFKEVRYLDDNGGRVTKDLAIERIRAGECISKLERYYIDLRWTDPKTRVRRRHTERLPDGINAASAKKRALDVLNATSAGTFEKKVVVPKRLHEALDEYLSWSKTNLPLTHANRKSIVKILKERFTDRPLGDLAPFDLERFKRDREKEGAKPATINRAVSQMKRLYTLACDWEWCSREQRERIHCVSKLKEPPGRVRSLSVDEEGKLFASFKGTMLHIVTAAELTGMRRAEVVLLRKDAIDLQRRKIVLRKTKSNRVRELAIGDALADVLRAALANSPEESAYVFTQHAKRNKGKPYALSSVSQAFRRTKDKLKIADLRLHDIRHDTATKMRRSGVGIDVISKVLGHSTIAVTMRYAHIDDQLVRAALEAVPAPVARPLPDEPKKASRNAQQGGRKIAAVPVR